MNDNSGTLRFREGKQSIALRTLLGYITGDNESYVRDLRFDAMSFSTRTSQKEKMDEQGVARTQALSEYIEERKHHISDLYTKLSDKEKEKFGDVLTQRKTTLRMAAREESADEPDKALIAFRTQDLLYLEKVLGLDYSSTE